MLQGYLGFFSILCSWEKQYELVSYGCTFIAVCKTGRDGDRKLVYLPQTCKRRTQTTAYEIYNVWIIQWDLSFQSEKCLKWFESFPDILVFNPGNIWNVVAKQWPILVISSKRRTQTRAYEIYNVWIIQLDFSFQSEKCLKWFVKEEFGLFDL